MKYKDFKKALDAYFKDDDEIYHWQPSFRVDKVDRDFEFIDCRPEWKKKED